VTGIDISDGAIDQARETARSEGIEARFEVMDAENLAFPADSFDLVCGTGIIHHLELNNAFAQIVRVLRPGGVAVFAEPLGHNPLINWYRDRTPDQRTPDEHPLVVSDFALARRYFGAVGVHPFHLLSLFTVPFRNSGAFPGLLRASDAADRALFRVIPYMARHAWTAVLVMEGPQKAPMTAPGTGSSQR